MDGQTWILILLLLAVLIQVVAWVLLIRDSLRRRREKQKEAAGWVVGQLKAGMETEPYRSPHPGALVYGDIVQNPLAWQKGEILISRNQFQALVNWIHSKNRIVVPDGKGIRVDGIRVEPV